MRRTDREHPYLSLVASLLLGSVILGATSLAAQAVKVRQIGVVAVDDSDSASGASSRAKKKKAQAERGAPTFALVRGQAIVGVLAEKNLSVLTKYGELEVPFEEILRVRFHPRLSKEDTTRLSDLLTALRADPEDGVLLQGIRDIGPGSFLLLSDAMEHEKNEAIQEKLKEILDEIGSVEGVYLDRLDEVMTQRFTIKGHIQEDVLQVARGKLKLSIPVHDIRHIAYGQLEIHKKFKIGPSHTEGSNSFLDTKFNVKKNQRFTLSPSGNMTWQGQSFGPAGISNHTWNSRKMGCLQWRIGNSGAWKILPSDFEGKADASGPLQFCVHLTSGATSGEFKVLFKAKTK